MKYRQSLFLAFLIAAFVGAVSFAQTDTTSQKVKSSASAKMAVKLQQKILLNDTQTSEVEKALNEYYESPNNTSEKKANLKIQTLLDSRQKAKYEIIKGDWWKFVKLSSDKSK